MSKRINSAFPFAALIFFLSCCTNELNDRGFIVFEYPNIWYFVPVKSMDQNSCLDDFNSENLQKGFEIPALQSNYLIENLDTVNYRETVSTQNRQLKIIPVEVVYISKSDSYLTSYSGNFKVLIDDKDINFDYTRTPLQIKSIKPIFCFLTKPKDVKICECEKNKRDPDDYLYKICNYLKEKGDPSFQPCKYKIEKIDQYVLDGKGVIKIELNCCFLGDKAFFDPSTKELIRFSYGAK